MLTSSCVNASSCGKMYKLVCEAAAGIVYVDQWLLLLLLKRLFRAARNSL